jgi:hypothetical protein
MMLLNDGIKWRNLSLLIVDGFWGGFDWILMKRMSKYKNSVLILNPIFIGVCLLPTVKLSIHLALITTEIAFFLIIEIAHWAFRLYWVAELLSFVNLCPHWNLVGWDVFLNSNRLIGIFRTLIMFQTFFLSFLPLENLYFVGLA